MNRLIEWGQLLIWIGVLWLLFRFASFAFPL